MLLEASFKSMDAIASSVSQNFASKIKESLVATSKISIDIS